VTGSVTITEAADGAAEVAVTIDSGLEEGSHLNHIHEGSCDPLGEVLASLTNLEAGADGGAAATTTTVTDPDFEHLAEGGHVVAVHDLQASPVACVAVEASAS